MHWITSDFSSNVQFAKPARPTFCDAFCEGTLAHQLRLKLHFTASLCDVSWWECNSGWILVLTPFRQIFLQRSCKELSNLDFSHFFLGQDWKRLLSNFW